MKRILFLAFLFSLFLCFNVNAQSVSVSEVKLTDDTVLTEEQIEVFFETFKDNYFNFLEKGFLDKGLPQTMVSEIVYKQKKNFDYEEFKTQSRECFKDDKTFGKVRGCMVIYIKKIAFLKK